MGMGNPQRRRYIVTSRHVPIIRAHENAMQKIIQCPCGSVIEGENDDHVVKKAQEHAKTTHGMELSKEQALAMARPK
jgi:predicted small metal-binding protein